MICKVLTTKFIVDILIYQLNKESVIIKFYTNRELSLNLKINLSKWKRWSREFLAPDPLGGMQSGYARQYNLNSAFKVLLGGHLVSGLKFSIPEAKNILEDIDDWLFLKGFYQDTERSADPEQEINKQIKEYRVLIQRRFDDQNKTYGFCYIIRGLLSIEATIFNGLSATQERYLETFIHPRDRDSASSPLDAVKLFDITQLYQYFLKNLNGNS